MVGNLLFPQTVTRAHGKRLKDGAVVVDEARVVPQPALWDEGVGEVEVGGGVVGGVLGDGDCDLMHKESFSIFRFSQNSFIGRGVALWEVFTFPGTEWPAMISPSGGVRRGRDPGTGGYIRILSSSTAWRYGNWMTLEKLIWSSSLNVERISLTNLSRTSLFLSRWKTAPERRVAVVSLPAAIRTALVP